MSTSDEFVKIINDFVADIATTFPEYVPGINSWWTLDKTAVTNKQREFAVAHCAKIYPERTFDIFYKNDKIFSDPEINTFFLPGIDFGILWESDISDSTKEVIWKYLKVLLFVVLGNMDKTDDFGPSKDLFEAISKGELKDKLDETFGHFEEWFSKNKESGDDQETDESTAKPNIPTPENIQEKMDEMMGGKIGKLAMEIAKESAKDLGIDLENVDETNKEVDPDTFKKMFSDPSKLMGTVKSIGEKIKAKIASGELKESELMEEGMELMEKMKGMPGMENMGNMKDMLNKMAPGLAGMMGGATGGGGGKVDVGAMKNNMEKSMRVAKMRDRLKEKARQNAIDKAVRQLHEQQVEAVRQQQYKQNALSEDELIRLFDAPNAPQTKKKSKKSGGKNKK